MSAASTAAINRALRLADWSIPQLWRHTLAVGGDFAPGDLDDIASGRREATATEHDILAATFNDYFFDLGRNHPIRYWRDL